MFVYNKGYFGCLQIYVQHTKPELSGIQMFGINVARLYSVDIVTCPAGGISHISQLIV